MRAGRFHPPRLTDAALADGLEELPACCVRPESRFESFACTSVTGRRVLVTGAGGSIGSELAKQIARLGPSHLALVDLNEFNLYRLGLDLGHDAGGGAASYFLGHVCDEAAMRRIFMRERPEIVFHAAALKHVPLLESDNVVEAARTNVLGTEVVSDLCLSTGCEFVLISTDKAVNPSSCMGLTKRVAEIQAHDRALHHPEAKISVVRFGNVLGSSGSVVPLFRAQIRGGGPVTVTHPEMTRYMMTIKEAVHLTLAASSLPQAGFSLYVLDMGEPVRIVDLALEMIEMAGLRPFVDIDVDFVGLRPGEKMHEELNYPWESLRQTAIPGVRAATPAYDPAAKRSAVNELKAAANARDADWVKSALIQIVPEYVGELQFAASAPAFAGPQAKLAARALKAGALRRLAQRREGRGERAEFDVETARPFGAGAAS